MTDEYYTAVREFGLTWAETVQLGRTSLEFAFVPAETKARLLAEYERDVAAFAVRFGGADWREALKAVKPVTYGYAARKWQLRFN